MDKPNSDRISEDKASLILERAAQLDSTRGREIDVRELREAAVEAGISAESFERALLEVREQQLPEPLPSRATSSPLPSIEIEDEPTSPWHSWLRRLLITGTGFGLGGLGLGLWQGLNMGDAGIIFTLLIAMLVAFGLVAQRRKDRKKSVLGFVLDLGLLWIGITFLFMIGDPSDADEVLAVMSVIGVIAAGVGGILVALPRWPGHPELPART